MTTAMATATATSQMDAREHKNKIRKSHETSNSTVKEKPVHRIEPSVSSRVSKCVSVLECPEPVRTGALMRQTKEKVINA